MTIRLNTLGGLRAVGDEGDLDSLLGRRLRAALFVYLAVERRVARASLATVFWAERDEEQARHALRQSLYDLRKVLGDGWLDATAHEVRVSPRVHTDAHAFLAALERGDAEAAARLYEGPFLDGMHLVDSKPWETWVDGRRAEYGRLFRRTCRDWLEARRSTGDLAGALEAAQRWVAPDPFDDEAQHRLIEALAEVGERGEAIRQYEMYARLLEPDGLRPLDETSALMERVRSEAAMWPERATDPESGTLAAEPERSASDIDPSRPAPRKHRRVDRRRPSRVMAGIGLVAVLLGAFWLILTLGLIDAPDSLVAEGTIAEGERVVLAEFGGPQTDQALGEVVTDALRIDLLETEFVRVIDPSEVRDVLEQMQVERGTALTADRAREVALRVGAKAVLDGEIAQAGTGYVLTAALRSAESGHILAAFRETARGPNEVIPAIDRLSRQIRRRAGESLRSLAAAPPLARVTSSSLDALRVYGEADRAFHRGDDPRAISLLEETLDLDPEFAMAWRLLAIILSNTRWDREREVEAATRAYQLRDRLRPRERYLAAAAYHTQVTHDKDASIDAYTRVLELSPQDPAALNNLGLIYSGVGDFENGADLFMKAIDRPDPSVVAYSNLVRTRLAQQSVDEAREVADALYSRYPDHPAAAETHFWVLLREGDEAGARARMEPVLADPGRSPRQLAWAHDCMARLALWRGRLEEARRHLEAAERIARDAGPPLNAFAWRLRRAHAEVMVGDPDRGVRLLRQGIEEGLLADVSPPDQHHLLQGVILGMAGQPDDVEAILRRFEAEVPAELRAGHGARNGAVRAFIDLHHGEPEKAVRTLEMARAAESCRFCFAERMGWALRDAGRLEEAAREWEVAVAKDGFLDLGSQLAHRLWTLQRLPPLYEQLGDTAEALRHYRRIVELWRDADAELQPRVDHARERIAALEGRSD